MKQPIRHYEANTVGRDFVIGDLHGCFDVFLNLLANLNFDPEKDRMFSACDLVDRGPDSRACLELLRESWFAACLANHEQMMLEAFKGGYMGQYWFRNGGLWGLELCQAYHASQRSVEPIPMSEDTKKFMELIDIVEELPFVMTIDLVNGKKVHVIHAELPPGWVITDQMMADPEQILKMAQVQSEDGDFFVWGRHKYYQFFMSDLSNKQKNARIVKNMYKGLPANVGLSHIVSGHTKVQRPLTIMGQTNIDTAAHESYKNAHGSKNRKWAALTCIELNTWKFYQATDTEFEEVEPVVVNIDDDTTELKGTQNGN
jgi:serine/threonine protein phosphatase 1